MSTALKTMTENRDAALSEVQYFEEVRDKRRVEADLAEDKAAEARQTTQAYQVAIDALDTDRG